MGTGDAPNYQKNPLTYGYTIGTTVTAIVGYNPGRAMMIVHNPNPVAFIAIAPPTNTATGGSLVPGFAAAGQGAAGSTVIVPYGSVTLTGKGCASDLNAVSDTVGATITVWEFV